ncbi:MAG: autotransporter domain-containing protein [Rickettsiales bacterium]|nr:autotransporter domain-containing protein [Rickettsiales bacterium]
MSPNKTHKLAQLCLLFFVTTKAQAVTLTAGQTDYTTTSNITTSGIGISSSLSGSSSSLNKIKNTFTITTGNSGAVSGSYGIRVTGDYNQITNDSNAFINTTGSSGRGISISDFSQVYNLGTINTIGSTSYGIYAGGDSNLINNSGAINTSNSSAYGIYLSGDNNSVNNSGAINTQVYGIYSSGNGSQINNFGIINTTISSSAHGIFVSAGSASNADQNYHAIVTNSGIINSSGNGIYNKDAFSEITNSGTISTAQSSIYGIRNEGDNATITNLGNISAINYAIYNSGNAAIINNYGTLSGGVFLGLATLNILGGTISNVVEGENSGNVNIGSNSDVINFNQTANFNNLNNLTIKAQSVLNSSAAISANNIFIDNNSTLNLNNGSAVSGAISGLNAGSGTLNISDSSFTISNIGSNSNSLAHLNINDDAALNTANNIYADNISIAGTLNFNATDNLTIFGNVVGSGSGLINVADKNQIIIGNLTLQNNDQLNFALKDNSVGSLTISGSTTIDPGIKIAISTTQNQKYIKDDSQYKIIIGDFTNAQNGLISDQNILVDGKNSNISGLLKFEVQQTSDALNLNVNHLAPDQVTSNKNAQNIYQNLVEIGSNSTGNLAQFQQNLDASAANSEATTQTINQLAPQSSKAAITTTNNITNNSISIAQNHLEKLRHSQTLSTSSSQGIWGQIFGGSILQKNVKDDDGYKASLAGIAFGGENEISDDTLVGASISTAKSSTKTLDLSKQNLIDSYQINFYGSRNFNKYFVDAIAGLALNHFSSNRAINYASTNAVASYLGQTYALKIKGGLVKNLAKNNFKFMPEIGFNFLHNDISGYSEKGADSLNLKVNSVSANFLEMRAGINLGFDAKIIDFPEFRKVTALFKTSYGYSFINDAPTTKASFQNQSSSFNSQISNVDRGSLKLGGELAAYHKDNVTFSADYVLERKKTLISQLILFKCYQKF